MSPARDALGVSRETMERLEIYATLLSKWNPSINLVSRSTIGALWQRHIADSLQVYQLLDHSAPRWADLGSGGGFPGLVVALCAAESGNPHRVTLVESDRRKAVFLRTVLRETGVAADVVAERIEQVPPLAANVVSARALADLPALLDHAARHLAPNGLCLFPKGKNWKSELQTARASWHFTYDAIKSRTDPEAVILKIEGLARA